MGLQIFTAGSNMFKLIKKLSVRPKFALCLLICHISDRRIQRRRSWASESARVNFGVGTLHSAAASNALISCLLHALSLYDKTRMFLFLASILLTFFNFSTFFSGVCLFQIVILFGNEYNKYFY